MNCLMFSTLHYKVPCGIVLTSEKIDHESALLVNGLRLTACDTERSDYEHPAEEGCHGDRGTLHAAPERFLRL